MPAMEGRGDSKRPTLRTHHTPQRGYGAGFLRASISVDAQRQRRALRGALEDLPGAEDMQRDASMGRAMKGQGHKDAEVIGSTKHVQSTRRGGRDCQLDVPPP